MALIIENHYIAGDGVEKTQITPNLFRPPQFRLSNLPDSIVIHYTAMNSATAAVKALSTRKDENSASAHLVVSKDCKIYQLAPFNYRTWHAGISNYNGRESYNHFSIGIEIDNLGWLDLIDNQYTRKELLDLKISRSKNEVVELAHKNPKVPKKYWDKYPDEQVEVIKNICKLLVREYPIKEILGHDEIAPDRKQDPGPAFPMFDLLHEALPKGRKDEDESQTEGTVSASKLNVRSAPDGTAQKVALPLSSGTKVQILEEKGGWYRVKTEIQGWVSSKYIK